MRTALRPLMLWILALSVMGSPAWGNEVSEGTGVVESKDLVARTLQIDGQVYRVTPRTALRDAGGGHLVFSQVKALPPATAGPVPLERVQAGRYTAEKRGGQWELRSFQLLGTPE